MRVRLLGTAAGGGFPQWNCRCANCVAARQNRLTPLAQCSLAFSPSGRNWYLVNATPDVTQQFAQWSELHPQSGIRSSPVEGVILTDGELDHVLGLLHLREASRWTLYAAPPVAEMIENDLRLMPALGAMPTCGCSRSCRRRRCISPTGQHGSRYGSCRPAATSPATSAGRRRRRRRR